MRITSARTAHSLIALTALCAGALAAPAWPRSGDAAAQVLREAYKGPGETLPPVARFEAAKSGKAFIIEQRRQGILLFRYVHAREVFALHRVPGPRGDIMLKNDQGAVMVRMSRVGGPVLFPGRGSPGIPAWRSGSAAPLARQVFHLEDLRGALTSIASDIATAIGHDVTISATGARERSAWLYADTAMNVRSAITRLVRTSGRSKRVLPPLKVIRLADAPKQALTLQDGVLQIDLVSADGFAGRPSSLRLAGFLSGKSRRADRK